MKTKIKTWDNSFSEILHTHLKQSWIILDKHYPIYKNNIRKRVNLDEISKGFGWTSGGGENIIDTGELQHLFRNPSSDNTGPTRGRDHANGDGTTLSGDLAGNGVGLSNLVPPVPSPNGNNRELGQYNCAANGGGDFLAALDAETDVAIAVSDDDEGLETRALTGTSLFLHRHDLHDLVFESGPNEGVDDLVLLDWEWVQVDLLQAPDFTILHEASKFRYRDPLLLLVAAPRGPAASSASPVSAASTAETATEAATVSASTFGHVVCGVGERTGKGARG